MEGEPRQNWAREKVEKVVTWVKNRGGFWRRRDGQPPEAQEAQAPHETADPRHILRLAELGGNVIKVGPLENKWSMHYPDGEEGKRTAIRGLLTKAREPDAKAVTALKPDQLLYDVNDIKGASPQTRDTKFQATERVITDVVTNVESYDYGRFAKFTAELSDLPHAESIEAEALYTLIASERTRQIMLKKYDHPNRQRIIDKTRREIDFVDTPADQAGMRGILDNVRTTVRRKELGMRTPVPFNYTDTREIAIYKQLLEPYMQYTKTGNEDSYREIVAGIQRYYTEQDKPSPREEPPPPPKEPTEEPPPQSPPSDEDEESPEIEASSNRFEVTPSGTSKEPLLGYYAKIIKSSFTNKRWTTTSPLQVARKIDHTGSTQRQTIKGFKGDALIQEVPVPLGYACDSSSIRATGQLPRLLRERDTGTFSVELHPTTQEFTVDVFPDSDPFSPAPTAKDTQPIHRGQLSDASETLIRGLTGTNLEKAEKIKEFINTHHKYPESTDIGDVDKERRRNDPTTTSENYIQLLEKTEQLDCEEGNTVASAMLRHADVPTRFIEGDKVDTITDGKAIIDQDTGHAWTEVWDGEKWVLVDFTPPKERERHVNNPTGEGETASKSASDELMPPGDATDQDIQQAEEQMGAAQGKVGEANNAKADFMEQLNEMGDNSSFADMEELMNQLQQNPQLFDDMKETLAKQMQEMEQVKRDELQDKIEQMLEDGFLDPETAERIAATLENEPAANLDAAIEQIQEESKRFTEYETRRIRVLPLVETAYEFLLPYLQERDDLVIDHDTLGRHGQLDKTAIRKPIKMMTGQVKNPRMVEAETVPELMMTIGIDISNSMGLDVDTGEPRDRIDTATDLVIFYNELLSTIQENHGHTQYAIYAYGKDVIPIKKFDEDYQSTERYTREDGSASTVKVNLMQVLDMSETLRLHQEGFALQEQAKGIVDRFNQTYDNREKVRLNQEMDAINNQTEHLTQQLHSLPNAGTRLLEALQRMSTDLHQKQTDYPDWFSTVTLLCDGADGWVKSQPQRLQQLRNVVNAPAEEGGLRDDNLSVVIISDQYSDDDEDVAQEFSNIVGETRTKQARTLEEIVTQEMERLAQNLQHHNDSR